MQKIAVVGSSYFEKYVEQIKTADMFPQVELFFIPDNGAPANIDINFVLNLIEEKRYRRLSLARLTMSALLRLSRSRAISFCPTFRIFFCYTTG